MWTTPVTTILRDHRVQMVLCATSTGVLGLYAGAVLTRKKYQEIADLAIQDVKRHYSVKQKEEAKGDLATLAAQYNDKVDILQYRPSDSVDVVDEPPAAAEDDEEPAQNIFESDDPETYWDQEEEERKRSLHPERPYVLTHDEFYQGERDYEQVTVTYYEEDGVLADHRDKAIDVDEFVGAPNVLRFGHASQDKNVVYVRNEKLQIDLEVLRHESSYSREVLGYIEHSDSRRHRRFRLEE